MVRTISGSTLQSPGDDYRKKVSEEALRISRRLKQAGHPAPLGDPTSGIMVVVEQPIGPRLLEALQRSLETVKLPDAYVTWTSTNLLPEELLSFQPSVLISIGPGAAREIDALNYPLSRSTFSEAPHGAWFSWTTSASGLSLPPLAPALDDERAKRVFWQTFLELRKLPPFHT